MSSEIDCLYTDCTNNCGRKAAHTAKFADGTSHLCDECFEDLQKEVREGKVRKRWIK